MEALLTDPKGTYVDGTLGNGGHAQGILDRLEAGGRLIGFDRDGEAIERTRKGLRLKDGVRMEWIRDNYASMAERLDESGVGHVNGVLLDLGVSSNQIDTPERGFSFMREGPLDMRMDRSKGPTAAEMVNEASESELADVIRRYGEERSARRIARAIVEARAVGRIETTGRLAEIVERAKGGRRGRRIHPATQTFQALRMATNEELEGLERVLETMIGRIVEGGRMAVLTFHSLEDRLVKRFFNRHVPREESLQGGGVRRIFEAPEARWIWKKPPTADEAERRTNPRSRSAKLRAVAIGG